VELRVVADDGTVLPAGADGEVCVRSPASWSATGCGRA
jgi:hypothetical protein